MKIEVNEYIQQSGVCFEFFKLSNEMPNYVKMTYTVYAVRTEENRIHKRVVYVAFCGILQCTLNVRYAL